MAQTRSVLEWTTLLDNAEWDNEASLIELLPDDQTAEAEQARASVPLRRTLAAVALSALLACAAVLWLAAQEGVDAIDAELRNVIEVESWLQSSDHITAAATLVDNEADSAWQSAYLRELELASEYGQDRTFPHALLDQTRLRSGLAMAHVTVSDGTGDAYRETRFYRETPSGWQRTSAQDAFWGAERVMETTYFSIRYRQADAQAVLAAAPGLDHIVEQLRTDVGLHSDPGQLTVEVAPVTLESLGYLRFDDGCLVVPSPLLMRAPTESSDHAVLTQMIVHPLVMQVWEVAAATAYGVPWHTYSGSSWSPMTRGVQMWLVAASDEPTGVWLSETVAWLYVDSSSIRAGVRQPSSADLHTLCRTNSAWRLNAPVYIALDSLCRHPNWKQHLRYLPDAPNTLRQLLAIDEWDPQPPAADASSANWQRSFAAVTVVDYFVQTYGREQLPNLVTGFRTHDSWETLIPAVTGVSAAEFEAGWQQYLADQYGYRSGGK